MAILMSLLRRVMPGAAPTVEPASYDARALRVRLWSRALGIDKCLYLYLPPEAAHGRRVPALYLLRGHEREWLNPEEDTSREGSNAVEVYLALRATGAIGPLALVMPGISSDDNTLPGLLTNFRAPQLARGTAGIGTGRFEDYFVRDLIPLLERHFPLDRARRAVAGFSLGGAMAVKIAAQHPALFRSVSAYDGTFLYADEQGRGLRLPDPVLMNPMFDPAFGVPRDLAYVATQSPANLILQGDAAQLMRLRWMVQYGPEAIEPWGSNFYRGEHLLDCLRRRGIVNALPNGALPDGDHTWRTADRHLRQTLPLHYAALAS
jgi:S-formylglutathione hydrolase FrmB